MLLDEDLARLYRVETKALIQAVKRNLARFPEDFMFQLTGAEWTALRSAAIRELMSPQVSERRGIGFTADLE